MNKPDLIWLNVAVFVVSAGVTLIGVPLYALSHGFDMWQVLAMVFCIGFCEISITAGYHRLWSHRAYEAHWLVRFGLALGGTFATQNSILHWSSDHRRHHRFVDDNQKDPYSAKRGFWYSHIGWMLREYDSQIYSDYQNVKDLKRDPIVNWQHKYYLPLVLGLNIAIPVLFGLWHGDILGAILLVGFARLFISHHFTFLINSLAHIWGRQPYSDKNSAKDNGFLAILTMGEGYHNFHHMFQNDYRNGVRWWHFDPTKWLIRTFASLGLASKLRRTPVERIESSRAQMLLDRTTRRLAHLPQAEELIERLQEEYELLMHKIDLFTEAKKKWIKATKLSAIESYDFNRLSQSVSMLKADFLAQKKVWISLNSNLLALNTVRSR